MPQPQHARLPSTVLDEFSRREMGRRAEVPWMFGQHKNRRVMEFSLTPCCYVPGFSVSLGQTVRIYILKINVCAILFLFKGCLC